MQTKSADPASPATGEAPGIVHDVLHSSGQALDVATRSFFEPRFGQDFSDVRIHTNTRAAESARQVNALAYTVGSSVVFNTGQFAPYTAGGQRLLAHELTHVVQQRGGSTSALRRAPQLTEQPANDNSPSPTSANDHAPGPERRPTLANGCFGPSLDGPGRVRTDGATKWVLSNFDVDQHYVKKEHFAFLRDTVVPKINSTPAGKYQVTVVGEASTTAAFGYNLDLSRWRAQCVSDQLVAAGLDDVHRVSMKFHTGELRGDLEQIAHGIDPRIGIEDASKRRVTILLLPAGECSAEVRSRKSHQFYAKIACETSDAVRVTIGTYDSQPIFREFVWIHGAWPQGCTLIPGQSPDFKAHQDFVQTSVDMRLAVDNPDNISAESDFEGKVTFFGQGANSYLFKGGLYGLFKIGMGGEWNPASCGDRLTTVDGLLYPVGPVLCGWAPDPPGHCDFKHKGCTEEQKMAASKRFIGRLEGGSGPLDKALKWIFKEVPPDLIDLLNPGGAAYHVTFETKDATLTSSLTRQFIFIGVGKDGGGGKLAEYGKLAFAPEQDATEPSRLATETPDNITAGSDFTKKLSKIEIKGGSNKIDLTTGAGVFSFFNLRCNEGSSRTYYGTFLPMGAVHCPDHIWWWHEKEEACKPPKCSKDTRTAGHRHFTAKIGRGTLANLPLAGARLAAKYGCKFTAAFMNIQSEGDSADEQIHREFLLLFMDNGCPFNVRQEYVPIDVVFERKLATEDPEEILAPTDFGPAAALMSDGLMTLVSGTNFPITFRLPGMFDASCANGGIVRGLSIPLLPVSCGPAPEAPHDSSQAKNHTSECNDFKQHHSTIVDAYTSSIDDSDYQRIFAELAPGAAVIPPDEYNDYAHEPGRTISPGIFLGVAPNPHGGPPIPVVGFAEMRIVRVLRNGWMEIQFLSDVCAFDRLGNVVLIRRAQCTENFAHAGDTVFLEPFFNLDPGQKIPPPKRSPSLPPDKGDTATDSH